MELPGIGHFYLLCVAFLVRSCNGFSNALDSFQQGPTITSLHIRSDIMYRFATTTVFSTIANADMSGHETTFDVTLPDAAYITNFTMEIEGVVYPGVVKEREVAKSQYDKAKKKGQSAGHIATNKPRDTNRFKVAVNVAAQTKIKFILTYNELLQRRRSSYDHTIYIRPRQIVEDFRVEIYIQESRQITYLRVPPLRDDVLTNYNSIEQNRLAQVSRSSSTSAYILYEPSPTEQRLVSQQGLSGLFVVEYDVDRRLDAGDVLVINGFFVHFFAPQGLERMHRCILFILDTSGSMMGIKMQQLKSAMSEILDDLQEGDVFNIIEFDGDVGKWQFGVDAVPVTQESIASAKQYTQKLQADGWTNINDALVRGIEDVLAGTDDRVPIVIFLTDGEPTAGETNINQILTNIRTRNTKGVPIFSLSFGDGADFNFLKRLSLQNNGFARKIYEASDADIQLTGFYDEVSSVLVSNVTFRYLDETVIKNSISNVIFPNFFEGSELVVTGQLADNSVTDIPVSISGESSNGLLELRSLGNVLLSDSTAGFDSDVPPTVNVTDIAEKIWAYVTVKQLLEERLKETNQTIRESIKERATELALKYNFVTPLTSMVVTKPEQDTMVDPNDEENTQNSQWGAPASVGQALIGKSPSFVDSDPHFIVHVKGLDTSVCFDIMGQPGDRLNLVTDTISGVSVTASVTSNKPKKGKSRKKRKEETPPETTKEDIKTYLGDIEISGLKTKLTITPTNWTLNGKLYEWKSSEAVKSHKTKIVTDGTGQQLAIIFPNKILLLVLRHMRTRSQMRMGKVPFLGFYIVEEKGFSWHTHGILGQLLHRRISLKKTKKVDGKTRGKLLVRGNIKKTRKLTATLGKRLNLATNRETPCWMIQKNGKKLIDGNYMDYVVRDKNSTVPTKRKSRRKKTSKRIVEPRKIK